MESIKFSGLDEFFRIAEEDVGYEYTVAWVDCAAKDCFKTYYPNWAEYSQFVDEKFSSSFYRRVMNNV